MTRHPLLPVRLLLLLAFVLAGALPQGREHDVTTPAALTLQDQGQGILGTQRAMLQALIPDDSADPVLPHAFAPPRLPLSAQPARPAPQTSLAPVSFASIPSARGPPAV